MTCSTASLPRDPAAVQLIVAGHDTTTSLIGNSVVALLRNPAQLAQLRADPGKIGAAIEEFMRYDAPVPHSTFRYAADPVQLGDSTIPAGTQVIISLAAANRDARRYANPEVLDIDRADTRHLAFGHGIHHCLGAPLARMEGQLALASLLRRFPGLRLAVPATELRWGHGDGLVLRGLSELPVFPAGREVASLMIESGRGGKRDINVGTPEPRFAGAQVRRGPGSPPPRAAFVATQMFTINHHLQGGCYA